MKKIIFIAVVLLNLNTNTFASEIYGISVITDGDTIKISNNKIRLHGIDAPEQNQKCTKNKKEYNCGVVATDALVKKIGKNLVKCFTQKNKDRYNRFEEFAKKNKLGLWSGAFLKPEKWRKLN